jgi:hypothetical protein
VVRGSRLVPAVRLFLILQVRVLHLLDWSFDVRLQFAITCEFLRPVIIRVSSVDGSARLQVVDRLAQEGSKFFEGNPCVAMRTNPPDDRKDFLLDELDALWLEELVKISFVDRLFVMSVDRSEGIINWEVAPSF